MRVSRNHKKSNTIISNAYNLTERYDMAYDKLPELVNNVSYNSYSPYKVAAFYDWDNYNFEERYQQYDHVTPLIFFLYFLLPLWIILKYIKETDDRKNAKYFICFYVDV